MKTTLKGTIQKMERIDGNCILRLSPVGKIQDDNISISAKDTFADLTLTVRSVVGSKIKFGSILTITVSDEDQSDKIE